MPPSSVRVSEWRGQVTKQTVRSLRRRFPPARSLVFAATLPPSLRPSVWIFVRIPRGDTRRCCRCSCPRRRRQGIFRGGGGGGESAALSVLSLSSSVRPRPSSRIERERNSGRGITPYSQCHSKARRRKHGESVCEILQRGLPTSMEKAKAIIQKISKRWAPGCVKMR